MGTDWQFNDIKIGDLVKIKCATRNGWVRGWRKVLCKMANYVEVRAGGYGDFIVHPHEIQDVEAFRKED